MIFEFSPPPQALSLDGMSPKVHMHISTAPSYRLEILNASLHARAIDPRLHYESAEQTRKWLALHQKYSPAVIHPDTLRIYDNAFAHLAKQYSQQTIPVISLGCGGGNKDLHLLVALQKQGSTPIYIPCDVSPGLVQEATTQAGTLSVKVVCHPVVSDLKHASSLREWLDAAPSLSGPRIFLFFGMLPNLSPSEAREALHKLLQPGDTLVMSANLVPNANPVIGFHQILLQYDNPETRDWLITLLDELEVSREAYTLKFEIQPSFDQNGLYQITAIVQFSRPVKIAVGGDIHSFIKGESLLLFFSNRHTPRLAKEWMETLGILHAEEWISANGEEGVFAGIVGAPGNPPGRIINAP